MIEDPPGAPPRDAATREALAEGYARQGAGQAEEGRQPDCAPPRYTNRLILESSPYLLQHAHNPVDWWPWGEAAFEEARRRDVPLLVSVGYATCHWCHVMERESFEDEETARYMNAHFVCVKVDREERPDVDALYMAAVQAISGHGGWPMNVFLDHSLKPFYGGTYYPPEDRWGRPGWRTLLRRIVEVWEHRRSELRAQAAALAEIVERELSLPPVAGAPKLDASVLDRAAAHFARTFDPRWGGFGAAPKFPRSEVLRFLLRYHRRTGDSKALEAVVRTLDAMRAGGIYDQVGGGFARYSVDEKWLVPHFEKMLYDNALLTVAYLEAYQATGEARFADVARDILRYVGREMVSPEGAFYSATDADSEGEEGRFFVWTPDEIDAVLGPERGRIVRAWYGVTPEGNFEGKNVLAALRPEEEVAAELGIDVETLRRTVAEAREPLYEARATRVPPLLDDKIIAAWNGLMISAFAVAGRVLGDARLTDHARTAAAFVLRALREGDRLHRIFRRGRVRHEGTLEDYAFLAAACLDLFEATAEPRWLDEAMALHAVLERDFACPQGGYYSARAGDPTLIARPREVYDGAVPAGTSVATLCNLRLFALTGEPSYREAAERALAGSAPILLRHPTIAPTLLCALDWLLETPVQLAILDLGDGGPALARASERVFLPNAVRVVATSRDRLPALAERIPWLQGRTGDGGACAYVCVEGACQLPVTDSDALCETLRRVARP
ncbi:MAG: thioredoxin domain-containing protein [Deltaproteobacteria bacterium]|nr:MAG: thioredoxin domain-containing protein [Deltaproteobacteria bacterium]